MCIDIEDGDKLSASRKFHILKKTNDWKWMFGAVRGTEKLYVPHI